MRILICLLLVSCSQINQQSQDDYRERKELRHGLVPMQADKVTARTWPAPIDENRAKRGEKIYQDKCLQCHGDDGTGKTVATGNELRTSLNLVNAIKSVPNFKFYMMVSKAKGSMPGWVNALSDEDIKDVEQYIQKLSVVSKQQN